jgi:hypothetical protein
VIQRSAFCKINNLLSTKGSGNKKEVFEVLQASVATDSAPHFSNDLVEMTWESLSFNYN